MPVMDEFKKEREAMKNGTPKQKFQYFMDYYKWYVIAAVIIIAIIFSVVKQIATRKDTALFVGMLDAGVYDIFADTYPSKEAFKTISGIDTSKEDILFDTTFTTPNAANATMDSSQKLILYLAAKELDVVLSKDDNLRNYAYLNDFKDLRQILSPEQLSAYQDSFYYVDKAIVDQIQDSSNDVESVLTAHYPDPKDPSSMEEPIPVAIYLPTDSPLLKDYYFDEQACAPVASIVVNSQHVELALRFLDYAMTGQ